MLSFLILAQVAAADIGPLMAKARLVRYQQDSALAEYRAIAKQRVSSGIGLSTIFGVGVPGPEKLAARFETVARVGWDHQRGAWGEVIGARAVAPVAGLTEPEDADEVALILPYHPGSDALWPMTELRGALRDHREWITHPLDVGSDSLYEFSSGDLATIRLPSGGTIDLREIRVRPRRPSEKLIVGSLWVDAARGSLVRAAYRPSTPVDLWPILSAELHGDDEKNAVKRFGPYLGNVREVLIEHGLYDGRFWLPRIRTLNAEATATGARITISIDQTFSYEKVGAMPPGQVARQQAQPLDSVVDGRVRYREWNGRVLEGPCRDAGDSSAKWSPDSLATATRLAVVYAQGIRYRVFRPCNDSMLVKSPALPGSIYGDGEALFLDSDLEKLRKDARAALAMDRQAKWNPQPALVAVGFKRGMVRYNRIEGISAGALAEKVLGDGYVAEYSARIGIADLQPNGEVTLIRENGRGEIRGTAFRRLATANEWGDPLGLGPSAVALVFGRDDGLYYRSLGLELSGNIRPNPQGSVWSWRLFAERQDSAAVETHRSFANVINGVDFQPNIQADAGYFSGASLAASRGWGSDPRGTRATGTMKLEGSAGELAFGRGRAEMTITQGLFSRAELTLTGSAGSSTGRLPTQRLWYLGGPYTVRGFAPGAMAGEAFWFGRLEIAQGHPVARPSVFGDLGWAGARGDLLQSKAPISGVGLGMTLVDGMIRLDVARSSAGKYRLDFYFDPR